MKNGPSNKRKYKRDKEKQNRGPIKHQIKFKKGEQ